MEQFLNLNSNIKNALSVADSLSKTIPASSTPDWEEIPTEEALKMSMERRKQAAIWVQAALVMNLSPFSVFTKESNSHLIGASKSTQAGSANPPIVVLESTTNTSTKVQGKVSPTTGSKVISSLVAPRRSIDGSANIQKPSLEPVAVPPWARGNGLDEVVNLAEMLRTESQNWFLGFVERFLDGDVDNSSLVDSSQIAGLLSQLKSVNDWLDEIGSNSNKGEEETARVSGETIDRLRKKIYDYLLTHVESAAAALQPPSAGGGGVEAKAKKR